jgi:hypothetical protein
MTTPEFMQDLTRAINANKVLSKLTGNSREAQTAENNAYILTRCKDEIERLKDLVIDLGGKP